MKIASLKIYNWRSVKEIEISFQDLIIFIGQNNCGKSNVLYSLLFFFGQIKVGDLDFNGDGDELYVEVKFIDLDENDQRQFKKYLNADKNIIVRKRATRDGGSSYHGYVQSPTQDWLKEECIGHYLSRDSVQTTPLNDLLPSSGRITKDLVKKAQEDYISQNRDTLEFTYQLETGQFLGLKSVAQGIFGEVYFVPAVKAASDELNVKGNALFNQLYSSVIQKLSQHNEEYKNAKEQVKNLVKSLNKVNERGERNAARPQEISSLETRIQNELLSWNTSIEIEVTPPDIDEVFRIGTNVWVDDGIRTDISRKGHGLQRTMIFALIKAYSQLLKEEREKEEEAEREAAAQIETQSEEFKRKSSKSTFFILEEPELYLHPQAQRELFNSLQELSKSDSQIVIATHSSFFVDLELYKSICVVRKNDLHSGTVVIQNSENLFADFDEKQKFNMVYWINPDRGELFFANKVILLEGQTDKTIVPFLAKQLECFRFDYTLIDCGSKDAIPIYIKLLNRFNLKYVVVYDKDHQAHKGADGIASADKSTDKIKNLIDNNFGSDVVFDNDIEEEIGIIEQNNKSKPYAAIQKVAEDTFQISTSLKSKIQIIYDCPS
jgi:predicted ATP-dependent endonuclease of OLD family